MKNLFNSIKLKRPKSNTFDLTHDVKFSGKFGELLPCMAMEVVPGDHVKLAADSIVRFAPLISPVMHRFNATIHYFFVPNRLLWDNWETFITNETPVSFPYITIDENVGSNEGRSKVLTGIGVPICPSGGVPENVNALPFAAYQMIYNEYYRDQNLIPEVDYKLVDGNNTANIDDLLDMRRRAWMHDYFAAALPFAQKGASVDIPLGTVELDPDWADNFNPTFRDENGDVISLGEVHTGAPPNGDVTLTTAGGDIPGAYDPDGSLIVGATTINDLRRAEKLQVWLEKMARGGSRYIEQIFAHFGVKSSDARLQRPEYICGVKSPVVISEVLNTTGEDGGLPQGNMAGHGVSVGQGNVGSKFIEEHGWIIGIMSVTPLPAYQQGITKPFLPKTSILDYYWPDFAHIGEQEVSTRELYAYDSDSQALFGYIPRYAEYRYLPNRVAGNMLNLLDYWTCSRIFPNLPTLNREFIEVNQDRDELSRIFAVQDGSDTLFIQILNKVVARRPMPVYGTPML